MTDAQRGHLIPTQRFILSVGLAVISAFIGVSTVEAFGKEAAFASCFIAPVWMGFCSAFIFGASKTYGLPKAVFVGSLAHLLFYLIPILLGLVGIGLSRALGWFFYFIMLVFPIGILTSVVGAILGWVVARAAGR